MGEAFLHDHSCHICTPGRVTGLLNALQNHTVPLFLGQGELAVGLQLDGVSPRAPRRTPRETQQPASPRLQPPARTRRRPPAGRMRSAQRAARPSTHVLRPHGMREVATVYLLSPWAKSSSQPSLEVKGILRSAHLLPKF
ncbi:hypothetical protein VULLAG_LOCUS10236 [Vulpes lagopus]